MPSRSFEHENKQKSDTKKLRNVEESIMSDAVLEELKLMRSDLTSQIKKLSDDVELFQRNTNERLQKIESVISKVEEIDGLKFKQQELEAGFDSLKTSLNSMNTNTEEIDNLRRSNDDLRKKVEHLERYSRDFNIRILGVSEEDGEDCMAIILDYITRLGFEHAEAEVENAHRTGKKQGERPRHIIAKLYSRPFKRRLLQAAKSADGKTELNEVKFVEDFTPSDFETRKKALPLMRKAFEEGKRVRFTKGKLFVDGRAVSIM